MRCPHHQGCALFPMFTRDAFLKIWQSTYCESDFARCERYKRSAQGEVVPDTLLPNGKSLSSPPKKNG